MSSVLVVGASGIVGGAVSRAFSEAGWKVYGLARNPVRAEGVIPVRADLSDGDATREALAGLSPDAVVLATWSRRETEAEMIEVNGAMVRNLLDAVGPAGTVRHVALSTGLKHYLGPFEAYGKGEMPKTPFREDQGRLAVANFYYAQEDEVFTAAERDGFAWSVHRPHTIIGKAVGNAMNMGTTLAVYATLCRESGRPFRFPGSAVQWESLTDMTAADLLGRHVLWATTTPTTANEAFNVVNGDVFRWRWMWERIAGWFGLDAEEFDGTERPLEKQMANDAPVWRRIAEREGLAEPDLSRLASAWHTDADLGRPIEVVTDMSKSRRFGFSDYEATDGAFYALFARLRSCRLIP